ncbi:MAG: YicC family protein [Lachnospiraceae bacterium]|nr:YicC family protein [Lachnospiraceae bacterium]
MIKSMTGFGRYEKTTETYKLTVEIKSVNHRYLELGLKLPKKLNFFEVSIRNLLKTYIQRGKVDVFITYEDYNEEQVCVRYNKSIAAEYLKYIKSMSEDFGIENNVRVTDLARFPEVFNLEEQGIDEKELWAEIEEVVSEAAKRFVESRITEGERLKSDLVAKLDNMLTYVDFVEERSPQVVNEYREKITAKVAELLGNTQIDQSILATEITLFADKICVDEETVRLRSHILNMKNVLNEDEGIGRKLDFIAQEMNREANTIMSKANDLALTNKAIELKTDIEKVREQIQNIE